MSWFGFGGSKSNDDDNKGSMSSSSYDSEQGFSSSGTNFAAPSSAAMGSTGNFQQDLAMEQQKAMVQQVMLKLTEAAFDACITKPSSSLSSSETACIGAVVGKYLDASEYMVGKFTGQQGGGGF